MLEVVSLGSGSSGNAVLVRTLEVVLLVDCGIEPRRLSSALAASGHTIDQIDAVLISHEHTDHAQSLSRITPARTRAFGSRGTALACGWHRGAWTETSGSRALSIADIEVLAIPVAHDAAEPCGFYLRTPAGALTVLTDLGSPSPAASEAIAASDLIVIEANHDETLLRRGPYSPQLKRRILSDTGHLSNAACGDLLASGLRDSPRVPTVWLAHLSETNNRPQFATEAVQSRLARVDLHLDVVALPRRRAGPIWRPGMMRSKPRQMALGLEFA